VKSVNIAPISSIPTPFQLLGQIGTRSHALFSLNESHYGYNGRPHLQQRVDWLAVLTFHSAESPTPVRNRPPDLRATLYYTSSGENRIRRLPSSKLGKSRRINCSIKADMKIDESPNQIRKNGDLMYLDPSSLRLREVPERLSCLCGPTLSLRRILTLAISGCARSNSR